jgi:hypothetical protein
MWRPKAAPALHEQPGAGVERGLGELDRANVGLLDEKPERTLVQRIAAH